MRGSLEVMTLLDMFQSLDICRKTARMYVSYDDGRTGVLEFEHGTLVRAVSGEMLGEEALYYLARPGRGYFRIERTQELGDSNVGRPNAFLQLEAARLVDESSVSVQLQVMSSAAGTTV